MESLYFIKDKMFRKIIITSWGGEDEYIIVGMNGGLGKRHKGNPTKYISNLLADGWIKTDFDRYCNVKLL